LVDRSQASRSPPARGAKPPTPGRIEPMRRLSSPIAKLKAEYEVVVVGSGYGGAIAASRLARAGRQVCVLERGRELQPGEYPDTLAGVLGETQLDTPRRHLFSRTGLYDFRFNEDISVFVGCGLGGTSLINASVALRPIAAVWADPRWPQGLRDDVPHGLEDGFRQAEKMLRPTAYSPPRGSPELLKLQALEKSAARLKAPLDRPPIIVTFREERNHADVEQHACQLCGDCVSGCNYGAKNTLLMNYLPDAKRHGAELYTEISVSRLRRDGDRWLVHYDLLGAERGRFTRETMTLRAKIVVLAAGTLGSTEILLRSADRRLPPEERLPLSKMRGHGFTGNADMIGIGYDTDEPVNGVGAGRRRPDPKAPVGPCITGMIDMRERDGPCGGLMIQEGAVPGALAAVMPVVLGAAALVRGRFQGERRGESLAKLGRRWLGLLRGPYRGAVRNTQTFLVMGRDDAKGHLYLEDDRLRISWPGADRQPIFERVNQCLGEATSALRGTYVANPVPITVHPLGGCCMAEDAGAGVVNHEGQVFSEETGTKVHETLYVCDGAVIPCPLGVNPLLTISALAERMCARLVARHAHARHIDYTPIARATPVEPAPSRSPEALRFTETLRPGLQLTEKMSGHFRVTAAGGGPGAPRGRERHPLEFTLTIISDDLERMLTDSCHTAKLAGTVTSERLSRRPMTVTSGEFGLFVPDPDRVETRRLHYWMELISDEQLASGKRRVYLIKGSKRVRNALPTHAWADLSTLHIRIRDVTDSERGVPFGKGHLTLSVTDFLRQLGTIRARNAHRLTQRLDAAARFAGFFAGMLFSTYGRMLARATVSIPDAPPARFRSSQNFTGYVVATSDKTQVHLTRYLRPQASMRPPKAVILSPGFSVSASSFATGTVDTNLVDYLRDHGYDVWLLDYRASSDFAAAGTAFTIDDIARRDYPAAVNEVCRIAGVEQVQMLVHCVGSMSLLMSLLDGKLKGQVRSVICSQLGAHPIPPTLSRLKACLRLATLLRLVGVKTISADFDPYNLCDRVVDRVLTLIPTRERCNNPVCRRILFLFGESYLHSRLNSATHEAIDEWFGVTSTTALAHIARIVRKGHIVDSEGRDVYLPNVERLKLPISFMHGTRNREFVMEGTQATFDLLREKNDKRWYRLVKIRGYGHMDCFIGRNAARDVFPLILNELDNPPHP
jgi:cholesterol oxidase